MKNNCLLLAGFLANLICIGQIIHVPYDQLMIKSGINAEVDSKICIPATPFSSEKIVITKK